MKIKYQRDAAIDIEPGTEVFVTPLGANATVTGPAGVEAPGWVCISYVDPDLGPIDTQIDIASLDRGLFPDAASSTTFEVVPEEPPA